MDEATAALLKSGGPWAAALVIVIVYLINRQKEIDRLHLAHAEKIEKLNDGRLQDHSDSLKAATEQNAMLAKCLNGLAESQNKMAETLTKLCETLDEMFVDKSNNFTGRKR